MDIKPIDFQPPTEEVPPFLLPVISSVFAERAERFRTLANGHSLEPWLNFLATLTTAQHHALQTLPAPPLPDALALEQAREHGMPPLNAAANIHPLADIWRAVLLQISAELDETAPTATRELLQRLQNATPDRLDQLASDLLQGYPEPEDAAELVIVGAALQVVWTAMAAQLSTGSLQKLDAPGVCPCCGSLPVGSIVRLGAAVNNLRYLHCSLCNTEWNVSRAICTACSSEKEVSYKQLEGDAVKNPGAMRAETCGSCHSYLKIGYQEKDSHVDPVADDLATLALDILVDEAGFSRSGPNLFLGGAG